MAGTTPCRRGSVHGQAAEEVRLRRLEDVVADLPGLVLMVDVFDHPQESHSRRRVLRIRRWLTDPIAGRLVCRQPALALRVGLRLLGSFTVALAEAGSAHRYLLALAPRRSGLETFAHTANRLALRPGASG